MESDQPDAASREVCAQMPLLASTWLHEWLGEGGGNSLRGSKCRCANTRRPRQAARMRGWWGGKGVGGKGVRVNFAPTQIGKPQISDRKIHSDPVLVLFDTVQLQRDLRQQRIGKGEG